MSSLADDMVAVASEETTPAFVITGMTDEQREAVESLCGGLRAMCPEPHFLEVPADFTGPVSERQHRQKRDHEIETHVRHWGDSMGYIHNQRTEVVFFDAARDLDQHPETFRQRLARATVPFVIVPKWDDCDTDVLNDSVVALNRITEDAAGGRKENKTYRDIGFSRLNQARINQIFRLLPPTMKAGQMGGTVEGGYTQHWQSTEGCLLLLTAPASLQYADENVRNPILDEVRDRCPDPVNILLSLTEGWLREWEPLDLINHVVSEFRSRRAGSIQLHQEQYQENLDKHRRAMKDAANYLTFANKDRQKVANLTAMPVNAYEDACKSYMKYINDLSEIELKSDCLVIKIPAFVEEDVRLGPYEVSIDLADYSVVVETRGDVSSKGYPHPHVGTGGDVCWGSDGFPEQVRNAIETHNLIELAAICIRHLKDSYSPGGAYQRLEYWERDEDEEICGECGENDYDPDYHRTCGDCYGCYNPDYTTHKCPTCDHCNFDENHLADDYCSECDAVDLPEDLRKEHYPELFKDEEEED
jgi:hypothetical protein